MLALLSLVQYLKKHQKKDFTNNHALIPLNIVDRRLCISTKFLESSLQSYFAKLAPSNKIAYNIRNNNNIAL